MTFLGWVNPVVPEPIASRVNWRDASARIRPNDPALPAASGLAFGDLGADFRTPSLAVISPCEDGPCHRPGHLVGRHYLTNQYRLLVS